MYIEKNFNCSFFFVYQDNLKVVNVAHKFTLVIVLSQVNTLSKNIDSLVLPNTCECSHPLQNAEGSTPRFYGRICIGSCTTETVGLDAKLGLIS